MSEETKLLPCPFCSGELEVYGDKNWRSGKIVGYGVIGHQNKCYMYSCEGKTYPTLGHLLEKWNKRSDTNAVSTRSPDVAEAIGEIEVMINACNFCIDLPKKENEESVIKSKDVVAWLTKIKKLLEVKS